MPTCWNPKMIEKQFLKFISVGIFSTLINYSVFYTLFALFDVNYLFSAGTGYVAGVYSGFSLNKGWTFGVISNSTNLLVKYFITYFISLTLGLILLRFLVIYIGITAEGANIIVIGFTTCSNFIGTKFWVFKK